MRQKRYYRLAENARTRGDERMFNETEFEVQKIRAKVTNKQIAEKLNIDESTLYRKIKSGGNFTFSNKK